MIRQSLQTNKQTNNETARTKKTTKNRTPNAKLHSCNEPHHKNSTAASKKIERLKCPLLSKQRIVHFVSCTVLFFIAVLFFFVLPSTKSPSSTLTTTESTTELTKLTTAVTTPLSIHNNNNNNNNKEQTKEGCQNFDTYGDISSNSVQSSSDNDSFFNCNNTNNKSNHCMWFHPHLFFDKQCGVASNYTKWLSFMEYHRTHSTLWINAPPTILQHVSVPSHYNITMIRIHKAGSSSLLVALQDLLKSPLLFGGGRMEVYTSPKVYHTIDLQSINDIISNTTTAVVESTFVTEVRQLKRMKQQLLKRNQQKNHGSGGRQRLKAKDGKRRRRKKKANQGPLPPDCFRNETSLYLNHAVKYRSNYQQAEHTLFGVIRDPVDRFISAIGQACGAKGSKRNGVSQELVTRCIEPFDDRKQVLQCFIQLLQNHSTWIEVHFTPQVYEISFATMYKDVPVAVFPFQQLPLLLNEFQSHHPPSKATKTNSTTELHKKNGKDEGYRPYPILTEMTVDDFDTTMLNDLCQLYHVDVLFMNHVGYANHCDFLLTK